MLVLDDMQWAARPRSPAWSRLRGRCGTAAAAGGLLRPLPMRDDLLAVRRLAQLDAVLRLRGLDNTEVATWSPRWPGAPPVPVSPAWPGGPAATRST
jgi:hypothetical protein